jgi:4'-phosphopantetheinyl transferase
MHTYWLTQTNEDMPVTNDWLSTVEIIRLNGFRFPKRRTDWRLGRWTAKQAIASCLHWPAHPMLLAQIEIRATFSGAPEALLPGVTTPFSFSISHRAGMAMCALSSVRVKLGCDVELVEPRTQSFVTDYFSPEEQNLVAREAPENTPEVVTLLWSAKESALKALGQGLRLDTRDVIVTPLEGQPDISGWSPLQVQCPDAQTLHGWWRAMDNFVYTVVSHPAPECPIEIRIDEPAASARYFSDHDSIFALQDYVPEESAS